jgi:hypothetical protein
MAFDAQERLREKLTTLVEQRRVEYQRMKTAGEEISRAELFEARHAYEQALLRLTYFMASLGRHDRLLRVPEYKRVG